MRYKHKRAPNENVTRKITKFLFWPKTINSETRWLEVSTYIEKYKKIFWIHGFYLKWVSIQWWEE